MDHSPITPPDRPSQTDDVSAGKDDIVEPARGETWDDPPDEEPTTGLGEVGGTDRVELRLARLEELWVRVVERIDAAEDAAETRAAMTDWLLHRLGEAVGTELPADPDPSAVPAPADPRGAWAGLRNWVVAGVEEAMERAASIDPEWLKRIEPIGRVVAAQAERVETVLSAQSDRLGIEISAAAQRLGTRVETLLASVTERLGDELGGRLQEVLERTRGLEEWVVEGRATAEERLARIRDLAEETNSVLGDTLDGIHRELVEALSELGKATERQERDNAARHEALLDSLAGELGRMGEAIDTQAGGIREALAAHDEAGVQRIGAAGEVFGVLAERVSSEVAEAGRRLSELAERGQERDDAIRRLGERLTAELALAQEQIAEEVRIQLRRQLAAVERDLRETTAAAVDQAVSRVRRITGGQAPARPELDRPAAPLAEVDRLIERMRQAEPS